MVFGDTGKTSPCIQLLLLKTTWVLMSQLQDSEEAGAICFLLHLLSRIKLSRYFFLGNKRTRLAMDARMFSSLFKDIAQ